MPKRLLAILVLAIVAAPMGAGAYFSGNDLLDQCTKPEVTFGEGICLGFINGVRLTLAYVFAGDMKRDGTEKLYRGGGPRLGTDGRDSCQPPTVTLGQLHLIVVKWMKDHPETLHWLASMNVHEACVDAVPCPDPAPELKK